MTVAYPLKNQNDYTELKYSLRSIDKFLKKPYQVLIIGERLPDWITNVTLIMVPDFPNKKQLTIKYKIMAALEHSEEIFFMNDDVYFLKQTDPKSHPYYFHGDLVAVGEGGARPLRSELTILNKPTKNFDGHFPLIYKRDFKKVFENLREEVIVKSGYCNYLGIEGEFAPDNKLIAQKTPEVIKDFIKDKPSFSTGVNSLPYAKPIMEELFKTKSRFEI